MRGVIATLLMVILGVNVGLAEEAAFRRGEAGRRERKADRCQPDLQRRPEKCYGASR